MQLELKEKGKGFWQRKSKISGPASSQWVERWSRWWRMQRLFQGWHHNCHVFFHLRCYMQHTRTRRHVWAPKNSMLSPLATKPTMRSTTLRDIDQNFLSMDGFVNKAYDISRAIAVVQSRAKLVRLRREAMRDHSKENNEESTFLNDWSEKVGAFWGDVSSTW